MFHSFLIPEFKPYCYFSQNEQNKSRNGCFQWISLKRQIAIFVWNEEKAEQDIVESLTTKVSPDMEKKRQ